MRSHGTYKRCVAAGLVVLGTLAATGGVQIWGTHIAANANPLSVSTDDLNLGDVWANETLDHTITVTNVSAKAVHVTDVKTNCVCTSLEPRSFSLGPGESVALRVRITFSTDPDAQKPKIIDFSTAIAPVFAPDETFSPVVWKLKATIHKALLLSPARLELGDELLMGGPFAPTRLEVESTIPVERLTAESESPFVEVSVTPHPDQAQRFIVAAAPSKEAPAGRLDAVVRLTAAAKSGEAIPPVTFPVHGIIVKDIQPTPSEVIFGAVKTGGERSATIALRSRSGARFEASAMDTPDGDLKVEPMPSENGAFRFRVTVRISRPGPQELGASVKIGYADENTIPGDIVIVPVKYYGMSSR